MVKAAIINCDEIRDSLCIGCERCLKAAREGLGNFEKFDNVDVVGMLSCGGCPGNVIPKLKLFNKWIEGFDDYDVIFLGNCISAASNMAGCPLDPEKLAEAIKEKFDKEVVIGTHPW